MLYLFHNPHTPFTFSYAADAGARSILVYDITGAKSYRIVLPKATCPTNDVLYIALAAQPDGTSTLFFTYLSSPRLYSIKGEYLRVGQGAGSIVDVGAKPYGKQMVMLGADGGNSLFFRYKGENDIYMWDSETCFKSANLQEVQRGGDCRLSTQVKKYLYLICICMCLYRFTYIHLYIFRSERNNIV